MPSIPNGVQSSSELNRFELLVDSISDYGISMLNLDGFITSWNSGAERITGYSAEDVIGKHFSLFFMPEDRESRLPERMLEAARTVGRYEVEGWRLRSDGGRFHVHAILQPLRDPRGAGAVIGFATITRDITKQAVAQKALVESEHRFRMLVEGVVDYAIYMLDPSGVVVNWNTGAQRLKGYSAQEIVGQHFSKFYTREDRRRGVPGRVLDIAAREGRYESEEWRVRKDGTRFWASVVVDAIRDQAGVLQGFAKVIRDITERRAAEDALRESERQFRLLVAGVTDYALFMLDPNGIVTSWNLGAQRIKGYAADEIIGHHFSRFYTERDRAAGLPARALQGAVQDRRFEAEGWRVRKDGTMFWANVVIDPIFDEEGKLLGFAKITRDITERREAQQSLERAQGERAQAQKMEALGQLTGGVAHDFNNLLMIVSGHAARLKRKAGDDPKAVRAVEAIEVAVRRGETLTRQLLTFSRRQTFNPTVFNIGDRIEACRMLIGSVAEMMKLITTVGPEVWPVKADANEFDLALVNLMLNARDAMSGEGIVSVTAENVVLDGSETNAAISGEFVALRVGDTGSGIAPDVLPKVFDPFFTTKQASKGTGLGLSQVHGFSHQSGGTVTIDSELGRGTTITLYLPRAQEAAGTALADMAWTERGDGLVLVVEDNPEVSEATTSMLDQLGYKTRAVSKVEDALQAIEDEHFDLIVSDIVMPGSMDGLDLARALRKRDPSLPILLVTGYSQTLAEVGTEFAMMRKPFQIGDLGRAVARLIGESIGAASSNVVRLRGARGDTPKGQKG